MDWQLIDTDPLTGTRTEGRFERDANGNRKLVIRQVTSHHLLNAVMDENRASFNEDQIKGSLIGNTQKHHKLVARIPQTLYYRWVKELGPPKYNQEAWKRRLNDHNYREFRTAEGHI